MNDQNTGKIRVLVRSLLCVLLLASGPLAFGQATTGTISGVVMDQSAATVPGATVTVRNLDTNATRSATTEADGRYNFPGLPVGRYELTAELVGFAKYVRGPINLVLNQVAI
ncbi:MAG: carboxypeptidase regulatory-like domain-containing protein, partial [Acidobacteria bacterium]|nr:carboxypeptidase regulatory-like domain-containing protein [Acidobacteriota bacterium]